MPASSRVALLILSVFAIFSAFEFRHSHVWLVVFTAIATLAVSVALMAEKEDPDA